MKIRSGFVTNSSSSSYVSIYVDSPVLAKIMKTYQEYLQDQCWATVAMDEDTVDIHLEEGWAEIPTNLDQLLLSFVNALGLEMYDEDDIPDDEDPTLMQLAREIFAQKSEILESIVEVEFTCGEAGWQGDSDARFDYDNYDEETLNDIMNEIAGQNGCLPEEVTEEAFNTYVSDKMSVSEDTYSFCKATGKETFEHSFYLE